LLICAAREKKRKKSPGEGQLNRAGETEHKKRASDFRGKGSRGTGRGKRGENFTTEDHNLAGNLDEKNY